MHKAAACIHYEQGVKCAKSQSARTLRVICQQDVDAFWWNSVLLSSLFLSVRLLEKIHHLTIIRHLAKGFITYPGNSSSAINDYKRSRHFKEIQIIFRGVDACKVPISICGWNIVQREQVMTPNFELVKDGDVYTPHWWHFYFQCPLEGFLYMHFFLTTLVVKSAAVSGIVKVFMCRLLLTSSLDDCWNKCVHDFGQAIKERVFLEPGLVIYRRHVNKQDRVWFNLCALLV